MSCQVHVFIEGDMFLKSDLGVYSRLSVTRSMNSRRALLSASFIAADSCSAVPWERPSSAASLLSVLRKCSTRIAIR